MNIAYRKPTQADCQQLIAALEKQGYLHYEEPYKVIEAACSLSKTVSAGLFGSAPPRSFYTYHDHERLIILHPTCPAYHDGEDFNTHTKALLSDMIITLGKLDIEAIYRHQEGWSDRLFVYLPQVLGARNEGMHE